MHFLSLKRSQLTLSLFFVMSSQLYAADALVLAHRGASGYLPEHSLAAKAMAHAQGSDYLEQDVVLTRDGVPLVLHDIYLDTLTDVAQQYPERQRTDGRFYAIDFTLDEIKQLRATQRFNRITGAPAYPARFPLDAFTYQLHTLEEEIQFLKGLNASTGRAVGLFPEIKQSTFHLAEGQDIVRIVFELLQRYGYADNNSGAIIHSFEPTTLRRLRELGWRAQLELAFGEGKAADGSDFEYLASADGLTELRTYVDSVWAPAKRMFNWDAEGELHLNSFTHDAKSAGLTVYGGVIAPEELPANCPSIDAWHDALVNAAQVDGVVTDFPDVTRTWLQKQRGETTL